MIGRVIYNYRWVRGKKKFGGEWKVGLGGRKCFLREGLVFILVVLFYDLVGILIIGRGFSSLVFVYKGIFSSWSWIEKVIYFKEFRLF